MSAGDGPLLGMKVSYCGDQTVGQRAFTRAESTIDKVRAGFDSFDHMNAACSILISLNCK